MNCELTLKVVVQLVRCSWDAGVSCRRLHRLKSEHIWCVRHATCLICLLGRHRRNSLAKFHSNVGDGSWWKLYQFMRKVQKFPSMSVRMHDSQTICEAAGKKFTSSILKSLHYKEAEIVEMIHGHMTNSIPQFMRWTVDKIKFPLTLSLFLMVIWLLPWLSHQINGHKAKAHVYMRAASLLTEESALCIFKICPRLQEQPKAL